MKAPAATTSTPGNSEPADDLTKQERANGWDAESLEAYRASRDRAADLVGGFVVTPFQRPKEHPKLIGAKTFNPHRW